MMYLMGNWDYNIPLIEFVYNNRYNYSIPVALFEALYKRRCKPPIWWLEIFEATQIVLDSIFKTMEKVQVIQEILRAT